jgi:hypothetical protein
MASREPEPSDLPTVADLLNQAGLSPTENAMKLLRAATQLASFKESDRHILSASGLLFAAVELASTDSERDEAVGWETRALTIVRSAFTGSDERRSEFESVIMADFYAERPTQWREIQPASGVRFSDGMSRAIESFHGGNVVDVVDLIAIALDDPSEYLQRRLNRLKVDAAAVRNEVLNLKSRKYDDAHVPFRSDAPSEADDALDRGQLALFLARRLHLIWCQMNGCAPAPKGSAKSTAIAGGRVGLVRAVTLFLARLLTWSRVREMRAVEPDTFVVHIDAPWGGGKTTFANFVARALNPLGEKLDERHFLRSVAPMGASAEDLHKINLKEIFFLHVDADTADIDAERNRWPERARQSWIVSRYKAWRDQYVQPPWWHIFQTILASIEAALWADVLKLPQGFYSLTHLARIKCVKIRYQVFNAKMRNQIFLIAMVTVLLIIAWTTGIFKNLLSYASEDVKKTSRASDRDTCTWRN